MTATRAETLKKDWSEQKKTPPPDYWMRRSVLDFLERIALPVAGGIALFGVLAYMGSLRVSGGQPLNMTVYYVVGALVLGWFLYRGWWPWRNRPIAIEARDGVMTIGQKGPLWLALSTSSDDTIDLRATDIDTIDRNIFQRFFNCDTMKLGDGRLIKNVLDFNHIKAIQKHVRGLESQNVEDQRKSKEVGLATLEAVEEQNNLRRQEIRLLELILIRLGGDPREADEQPERPVLPQSNPTPVSASASTPPTPPPDDEPPFNGGLIGWPGAE